MNEIMPAKSKRKGKVGELELAAELRKLGWLGVRRGQQYNGLEGEDVVGIDGIHIECKRCEKFSIYEAVEQAQRDAGDKVPIVFHRRNRKPWLAVIPLDQLPWAVMRLGWAGTIEIGSPLADAIHAKERANEQ